MNEAEQEKTPAQGIWCGKMCPELSAPTKEPISASCSKKPQKWPANKPPLFLSLKTDGLQPDALPMWEDNGALRGEYLMHSFGVCPKDENASHLSQILEASPHPKYSLSAKACLGILNRAEKRGKQLPEILKLALIQQAQRGGAYCIQGNCIDRADTAGCNGKGWTEGVSYTLNTIDRPAVLPFEPKAFGICSYSSNSMKSSNPHSGIYEADTSRTLDLNCGNPTCNQGGIAVVNPFVPAPQLTGGANPNSTHFRSGADNKQTAPQPNACGSTVPHNAQACASGNSDPIVFEPGSCSRVGGHIWQDGKAPALRAQSGDNQPAIALENHPADSRVKIAEDGIVQTLNARMGTGGGNVPLVMCTIPGFGT